MNVASRWKITYDPSGGNPLTLLWPGQLLESEIPWQVDHPVEVVNLVDGAAPFIRPIGNALYTLNFTTIDIWESDKRSRTELLAWLEYWGLLGRKPLRIEIYDQYGATSFPYWQFNDCYVTSFTPVRTIEQGRTRLAKTYNIVASGLTRVTS
jgi:hypothetical protein